MLMQKKIQYLLFLSLFLFNQANTQEVYERNNLEINYFLSSMSQKGYIEWNDLILPNTKANIKVALKELEKKKYILNNIEQIELQFYLKEYTDQRKKLLFKTDSLFSISLDPIISLGYFNTNNQIIKESSVGTSIWGSIGKKLGYQLSFQDINQNGSRFDSAVHPFFKDGLRGIVPLNDPNNLQRINFIDLRGSLIYRLNKASISIGQDALTWGYGENGQLVLSNKAPYYPYFRIDYHPLPWLRFNYTHAFLQSNIIDSANIYPIPSRVFPASREVFIKKYMASHSIDIQLKKGIHFSIGESIIYNDQLQLGYLLPVMFFKAYDNLMNKGIIQAGSNGQFFGQFNTKNILIPKSQFYSTLFIDEIRVSSILDPVQSRNQIGFNIGIVKQDFVFANLIIGAEYTRLNPFLYRNFLPAQNYTSNGYLLGDWIGSNSDKSIIYLRYTPIPRLKLYLRQQFVRNGQEGTMIDQYFGKPQMSFMNKIVSKQETFFFKASYEAKNRLFLNFSFNKISNLGKQYHFGLNYGL